MELKIQEIKTVGDVWAVYDAAGIIRPAIFQSRLFENASVLKKLLDRITELEAQRDELPKIVCLCGSTRFMKAFRWANLAETLAGKIVLSIGCNTKSDDALGLSTKDIERLKELHLRKIDLADEVYVLNMGGYVGSSTKKEIEYAESLNMPIKYLEEIKQPVVDG